MGSIAKTPSGSYRARWRDQHGRSHSKSFRRKRDAELHLTAVEGKVHRGEFIDPQLGRITFGEWVELWWTTKSNLRPATAVRYADQLRMNILPRFGRMQIARIQGVPDVSSWITDLVEQGVPASSIRRDFTLMSGICKAAVQNGLIAKNPCVGVSPPPKKTAEMRFLTVAEVDLLADSIGPRYRTMIYTKAYSGARWAELIGLERRNVDTVRRSIRIESQLAEINGAFHRAPPKTAAGRRTISIPPFLATMLDEHFVAVDAERAAKARPPLGPDDLVFTNRDGTPLRRSSFRSKHWLPAVKTAGLDHLRVHDLRHTAVALAINVANAHPLAIKVRMGHANIQVTLDTYGHLFPQMDDKIAVDLEAGFWTAKNERTPAAPQLSAEGDGRGRPNDAR